MDKDVRAQALDDIHSSASRSEQLTSFHDFDGGGRSGAKELVSNGVSGLYNRLKQSVKGGSPMKDAKTRPKSSGSKDTIETDSVRSSPSAIRTGPALNLGTTAPDTTPSPVVTAFSDVEPSLDVTAHDWPSQNDRLGHAVMFEAPLELVTKNDDTLDGATRFQSHPDSVSGRADEDAVELVRSALESDDRSENATKALARMLSHSEGHVTNRPLNGESTTASDTTRSVGVFAQSTGGTVTHASPRIALSADSADHDSDALTSGQAVHSAETRRPSMLHVGASHLPGFKASRSSSTTDAGERSSSAPTIASTRRALDPAPNLNNALQRRRTGLKSPPGTAEHGIHRTAHVPHHLKRRVISKEFWMKDENARDCFYCGQSFSTFRRKHHCRTCGQIFDAQCTVLVSGRPFGQPGTLRLCKPCEGMIYESDDDGSTDDSAGEEEPTAGSRLRSSVTFEDEQHARFDGSSFSRTENGDLATPSIGIPASRRNREAKRRSAVIEFDAHPALARPSSSHSLISLSRRPRSSSHRRQISRHQPGHRLRQSVDERGPFQQDPVADPEKKAVLPAFHHDNFIDPDMAAFASDDGSEDDEQPSIMSALEFGVSPGERERLGFGGLFASAMKKGRSKLGDRGALTSSVRTNKEDERSDAATKPTARPLRRRHPSLNGLTGGKPSPRRSRSNMLLKTIETDDSPPPSAPETEILTKVLRSSEMEGSDAPPIEINRASLEHVRKLLAQLLRDGRVEHAAAWEKALLPILLQCTDDVKPDVSRGDDMDIRHYVKLKKIPGGRPGDTSYVSGVVFSKNIALKSMARLLKKPQIAIITFSIEYARHQTQTHFMSLEPVIAQEREYLQNLVGRIATLKPDLLLVQKNVSGQALRLLDQAGITVAFNIKESVLAAVARVTQTTMIKSVDKLTAGTAHLGKCDTFEIKTYLAKGMRKNYVFLSGCKTDLGCTIVLRGGETKALRQIKRIAEFMCYVVYNLKLETTLMRDEFVSIPSSTEDQVAAHDGPLKLTPPLSSTLPSVVTARSDPDTPSKYEELEEWCRSRILSASPFVSFMQPYLLTQLREQERRLTTFKKLRDQYAKADEAGDEEKGESDDRFALVRPEMVTAIASKNQPKAVRDYLHAVHQAQYDRTMHTYETQKRLWESFMTGAITPFDPYSHQTIAVLHSTVSSITSAPCTGPAILGFGFYAGFNRAENSFEADYTLGQYIEGTCREAGRACEECDKRMLEHHHQYVHGYGQLSISVQRAPVRLRGYDDSILMWSTCRICHAETAVGTMSDDTWKYSFAKYLELSFWSSPLKPRAGVCEHDIHKDFLRCFGFRDLVVRVQYDKVDIYDVVVPRSTITWKVEADLVVKNEQYHHFFHRLTTFMDSVRKRLDSINVDTLDEKKSMEAHEKLQILRQRVETEHTELLVKLQSKYSTSRYYELIPLNRALRFMDEKAIMWDDEFNRFETDYFPSETDIRKLATLQLRNMFLESQPATSSISSDVSDTEDSTADAPMNRRKLDHLESNELHSEEAHDLLTSTAMEHRSSQNVELEATQAPTEDAHTADAEESRDSGLARRISPREEREQAADREDVRHLDLAVPAKSPDDTTSENFGARDELQQGSPPESSESTSAESFAVPPKPLGSSLLERIEQIRSNRASAGEALEPPETRIPRLADLRRRDISPAPSSPPLLRAQSQPTHVLRPSADLTNDNNLYSIIATPSAEPPSVEMRLGDRLGMSRLASKVGKVAPSLIPRSIPQNKDEQTSSSVSALAKHFEQMSREFEKERLKERRQRALRSRQARANPVASSRPIVEVYRNANDAVGGYTTEESARETLPHDDDATPLARYEPSWTAAVTSSDEAQDAPSETASHDPTSSDEPAGIASHDFTDRSTLGIDIERSRASTGDNLELESGVSSSNLLSPISAPDMDLHSELSIPEHRKNVWFKYLADFWSKRSASGWANLEYPLHATEHVFEDSDIIVREDEPSSVVALSLACVDYVNKVQDFRSHPLKHTRKHVHSESQTSFSMSDIDNEQQKAIEDSLLSDTGTHMKYSFAHGTVKASCKIFYAESFDALRRRCGVSDRFVESMSRCLKYDSKGGKTKSIFLKTLDNRFIIKSLQEVELKAFTKFAPDYFAFMSATLFHGVPSVIAKMFGLFQVTIKNAATGTDFSYYLLVMENLFYERNPNRRFDLKGSMRNRKIESTGQPDEVLLDENLVETIFEQPLFVREHARKLMHASVFNDTLWLCKQNVMDYSLMAGFDDERKELVVGIIDCIRTYTWDKKLESWIKDRGKNRPTITSPKDYRNRFRVSMGQYVLQAPNCWHQFQDQMALPKTLREGDEGAGREREETDDTEVESCDSELFEGKRFWLPPGSTILLGRTSSDKQTAINHKSVSRKHLLITVGDVAATDVSQLHKRTAITLLDESKTGTKLNGEKFAKESKTVDTTKTEHEIQLGLYDVTFRLIWHPVVLTCASLGTKKGGEAKKAEALAAKRQQLNGTDIKVVADYVANQTTHGIVTTRNHPTALQALIQARWVVAYSWLDALAEVTRRTVPDENGDLKSPLEVDFDANWPGERGHIAPSGKEAIKREDEYLFPKLERANVFQDYTFVFLSQSQRDLLMPVITTGGGKTPLREVYEKSTTASVVEYVKELAGQKDDRRFRLSSQTDRGGIAIVRLADGEEWSRMLMRDLELELGQCSIQQSEFLDLILINDASGALQPLPETEEPAQEASAVPARASRIRVIPPAQRNQVVTPSDDQMAEPEAGGDDRPRVQTEEPAEVEAQTRAEEQPMAGKRTWNRRIPTKSRFQGFDDFDTSQFIKPASQSPEPSFAAPSQAGSVQDMDAEPSQLVGTQRTQKKGRKRPASVEGGEDEGQENLLDNILHGQAALKRQRTEAAGRDEKHSYANSFGDNDKQATGKAERAKKREKQMDVKAALVKRKEEEDERRRKDEEALEQQMEGIDIHSIEPTVEEMEILVRERPTRTASGAADNDRWDPAWNGRKNFKKFRPQGQRRDGPRLQRIIVPLEEASKRPHGVGDDYWLVNNAAGTDRAKSKSQSQSQTLRGTGRVADEIPGSVSFQRALQKSREEDNEAERIDGTGVDDQGRSASRKSGWSLLHEAQSQTFGTDSQRKAAGKRPAISQGDGPAAKKVKQTTMPVRTPTAASTADNGPVFRRRKQA
ncbi:hypothetical protein LTR62_006150 [Meristemomyces frigidus]|uniref:1-phosphatidylinositol-3-phosphate 5-kinase n=1 Tax=Meristemomyces frigidus TaxID=1508187 RepID=A0AAN7TNU1_9PEZI|nr:hypothetical protein LTR62_006150 [Meristemomyces frigidus]